MSTSWLVGSYPSLSARTVTFASEQITLATGSYYLYVDSSSISLVTALAAALNTHTTISDVSVQLTKSGKVRIFRTGGSSFTLTWDSDLILRNLLGFTGNLSGASTYTASNYSPLFWSPGRTESPMMAPLGVSGKKVRDIAKGMSATGVFRVTTNNTVRMNRFLWRHVLQERVWTTSESNGEYETFHSEVCAKGRQFYLWRNIDEDRDDTTTGVSWGTKLGPYKCTNPEDWDYSREIPFKDTRSPIELETVTVPEFS